MLRLMIVDDEQIIREALSEMIDYESIGYQLIATARNGMEAYDIICNEYPDVVITDIQMPFLNGLELIERSVKSDARIIFIVLSGYGEFEYARKAMKYGVQYYLLKPTDRQELINALTAIREELETKELLKREAQEQLLCDLQTPLEQCFIMEALERPEDFSLIFSKYYSLLSLPSSCLYACICSFITEDCLAFFLTDMRRILSDNGTPLQFPVLYVKNNAVLIFPASTLSYQEKLRQQIGSLNYTEQPVSLEVSFLQSSTTEGLFRQVLLKLARFERILLIDVRMRTHEIKNNIASPWRIGQIGKALSRASSPQEVNQLLDSIFPITLPLETARNIALGLFLNRPQEEGQSLDTACDFFRRLYSCPDIAQIRELMSVVLPQKNMEAAASRSSVNLTQLKAYVEQHLYSENLSLKWLAEHYLFVSVGYLSKQFVKSEGMRFSDYLNQKRMDEAIHLMVSYHKDNIKSIARSVGFGSNPQYFSQVFKRYTGLTPTDYIETLKKKEGNVHDK